MFFKAIFQDHVRGGWNTSTFPGWGIFFLSQVNVAANKDVTWMGWGQMTQVPPDLGKQAEAWGWVWGKRWLGKAIAFLASVGLEREFVSAKAGGDAAGTATSSTSLYLQRTLWWWLLRRPGHVFKAEQQIECDRMFSGEPGHRLMIRRHNPEVSILLRGVPFISWFQRYSSTFSKGFMESSCQPCEVAGEDGSLLGVPLWKWIWHRRRHGFVARYWQGQYHKPGLLALGPGLFSHCSWDPYIGTVGCQKEEVAFFCSKTLLGLQMGSGSLTLGRRLKVKPSEAKSPVLLTQLTTSGIVSFRLPGCPHRPDALWNAKRPLSLPCLSGTLQDACFSQTEAGSTLFSWCLTQTPMTHIGPQGPGREAHTLGIEALTRVL